jgi:peptidoglycan/LPS O-acetylase OafA/YrhL
VVFAIAYKTAAKVREDLENIGPSALNRGERSLRDRRNSGIQYLRALCAGVVLVSHENGFLAFPQYFGHAPLQNLHLVSLFAVSVFFSISGFIIVVSTLGGDWQPRMGTGTFLWRRAMRILPFLWLCTFAYNALSAVGTHSLDSWATVRTLALWPVGSLKPNIAWSLRHEALFYLLFAAAVLAWPRWRIAGVAWLLAPLVFAPLIWDWHVIAERDGAVAYDLYRLVLAGGESGANLQFGIGALVGLAYLRGWLDQWRLRLLLWHLVALFAVGCMLVHLTDLPSGFARMALWTMLSGVILFAACVTWPRTAKSDGIMLALGNSSFSLYLMHNTVMLILLALSMKLHLVLPGEGALLAYLALCVGVSLFVCHALHRWVEKPLHRACAARLLPRTGHGPRHA